MSQYNFTKEADKLKSKRTFSGGLKLKKTLPMGYIYEKKISQKCENLKEFQEIINKVLDNLENQTFDDIIDLELAYYDELGKYGNLGILYNLNKFIVVD